MKKLVRFLPLFVLLLSSQILALNTYYVDSLYGNDSNNALTPQNAWKSINKINDSMGIFKPGDKILLKRGGIWTDATLIITSGGSQEKTLYFGAYGNGNKPIIDCEPNGLSNGILCSENYVDNIIIEDFDIRNAKGSGIVFNNIHSNIVISSCNISNCEANGIYIEKTNTYTIEGCIIHDCKNSGIVIYGSPLNKISNGKIIGNTCYNIYSNDGITIHKDALGNDAGPNHLIEYNICYSCYEQGLDFTSGSNIIARCNETYNNGDSGVLFGNCDNSVIDRHFSHNEPIGILITNDQQYLIIKNCIIYNPKNYGINLAPEVISSDHIEIYHNTVINGPNNSAYLFNMNWYVSFVTFKNNILTSVLENNPNKILRINGSITPEDTHSVFDYNVYWCKNGDEKSLFSIAGKPYNYLEWQSVFGQDFNGYFTNPDLINPANGNFQLQSHSICIDNGTDVSVKYDYENVKRPQGLGYDIGAFEYNIKDSFNVNINTSTTKGQVPLNVNFSSNITGGISPYSYNWNFGDGSFSSEQNPSHTYSSAGTYTVTLIVTDYNSSQASDSLTITVSDSTSSNVNLTISSTTGSPAPGSGGTTNPSPGNHSYSSGSSVQITAIPNANYRFAKWTGDISASDTYEEQITITMNSDKSISAQFFTKCGDVNGDLSITPADAQDAFDIFLGKIANPTESERENADVNCDGTKSTPNVTPADAQAIFDKFLGKDDLPCDCSCKSRAGTLSATLNSSQSSVLPIDATQTSPGEEIVIPIIVDNPSSIKAFGFDLIYPEDTLEFIGIEQTETTNDFYRIDANKIAEGVVRAGGYGKTTAGSNYPRVLIKLIFKVAQKTKKQIGLTIINMVDDIRNSTLRSRTSIRKIKKSGYVE